MPTALDNAIEIIRLRQSVRTYDPARPVGKKERDRLEACMQENRAGPLGHTVRFKLLDLGEVSREELRQLGTYGVIRGASLYLLGAAPDREGAMEDLGFCLERILLEATALGLGSCWLAGTFRRASFARQMGLTEGELLPAISPLGYAAPRQRLMEKLMQRGARCRQRKPWRELFFTADGRTPLSPEEADSYRDALEAVRLGPSAFNCQPWRLVKDRDGQFHLFLQENRLFNRALGKVRVQNLDMGIAMCHFALVIRQQDITGRWKRKAGEREYPGWSYIASWQASC